LLLIPSGYQKREAFSPISPLFKIPCESDYLSNQASLILTPQKHFPLCCAADAAQQNHPTYSLAIRKAAKLRNQVKLENIKLAILVEKNL